MDPYATLTREELIARIEALEEQNRRLAAQRNKHDPSQEGKIGHFKRRYAERILDTLPDMLTVLSADGEVVDLVSSEETNHVGAPGSELIGRNIRSILSEQAAQSVEENLDRVIATGKGSTSHHDITLEGITRHYENRIFPLDGRLALCMCRDVTDQQVAQSELEQANRRMAKAEQIASLNHWYYYEKSNEYEAPGLIPRLSGIADRSTTRCTVDFYLSHVNGADREKLLSQLSGTREGNGYVEYRIPLDGKMRYLHSRVIHTYKQEGYRVVEGYTQDMTHIVERLHELETVKYALNNAVEEIFACSLDGSIIFANKRFRLRNKLFGDISRRRIYDLESLRESPEAWKEQLAKLRSNDGTRKYTVRSKGPGGKTMAMEIVSYIVYDPLRDQEIVWFFGRDITLRLEHENKVKELNLVMDTILNNIPVYLFVKDPGNEFRYLYWNRAFEEYSHISAAKALGSTDFEIFPNPRDAEKFRRDDLELLRKGGRVEFLEEYVTATGQTRIVNTSKALIPVENRLPLVIGISWDVTEMKYAEKELIAARMKAEESDRLKSAFLANMSHEIRTPLNAIVGFSKLVGEAESEEEKQQFTEIIDSNSELLLQLVNDILDISKIEAGTLEFSFRQMNLRDLCREQWEIHKNRPRKGVRLVFDEQSPEVELVSDYHRLAQVIANLIGNAIKFTPTGEIRFGYRQKGEQIEFFVSDTGEGIPEEETDTIFNRFTKLNTFAPGTGLGLAITKMIVERLDGKIVVESQLGRGSTFRFTVPYLRDMEQWEERRQASAACLPQSEARRPRILVAEGDDAQFAAVEALLGERFEAIRAYSVKQAAELCESVHPDLMLADLNDPARDAERAVRFIRDRSPRLPVLIVASAPLDPSPACLAHGVAYLVKPLERESLERTIDRLLGGKPLLP